MSKALAPTTLEMAARTTLTNTVSIVTEMATVMLILYAFAFSSNGNAADVKHAPCADGRIRAVGAYS